MYNLNKLKTTTGIVRDEPTTTDRIDELRRQANSILRDAWNIQDCDEEEFERLLEVYDGIRYEIDCLERGIDPFDWSPV